jgi:hypothetical protein
MSTIAATIKSHIHEWRLSDWLWRIAILTLPWQTRFFLEGPDLSGFPWEQGRASIYLSMLFMAAYLMALMFQKRKLVTITLNFSMLAGFFLLGIVSLLSVYSKATYIWIFQVILLALFFLNLIRDLRVRRNELVVWVGLSMVPHALLGVAQFFQQSVFASTLLGMSSQNPADLGVSVVETSAGRILRAYGGFPHPNIFGGWLVFTSVGALYLSLKEQGRLVWFWRGAATLFTTALFLTFSRTAWLAALALLGAVVTLWLKEESEAIGRKKVLGSVAALAILVLALGIWQGEALFTRAGLETRLEQKSFDERALSIELAEEMIERHWLTGTGQGAYLIALVSEDVWRNQIPGPPIPPHNAFILLFAELGVLGTLGFLLFAGGLIGQVTRRSEWFHVRSAIFFVPVILLALFDHYLWSFWSGQVLFALVAVGWAITLDAENR